MIGIEQNRECGTLCRPWLRSVQETAGKSSQLVRIEAIQIDPSRDVHFPMQTYTDTDKIAVRVRPWQQILMFFVRTQYSHTWKSPPYRLGKRQRTCLQTILDLASSQVSMESEAETATDCNGLSLLEQAVLEFCISLLNQRARHGEYELALVCASAVLGVGDMERPWKTPDTYPQILSRLIKVAQMMVVQYASQLAKLNDEENSDIDEPFTLETYDSERHHAPSQLYSDVPAYSLTSSQLSKRRRLDIPDPDQSSTISLVECMTKSFMQRGTYGSMQWFLDLRAYGLKIHYKKNGHWTY